MVDARMFALGLMALLAGCTKPAGTEAAATPGTPAAATTAPAASSPVLLYNAYTSKALAADGSPAEPIKLFDAGDRVYVGVVLHGQAASAKIRVEWSRAGAAVGSGATELAVAGATVGMVEATREGPLAAGEYKALVYLDGAPSWELAFTVK